jgi:hypothetical protein
MPLDQNSLLMMLLSTIMTIIFFESTFIHKKKNTLPHVEEKLYHRIRLVNNTELVLNGMVIKSFRKDSNNQKLISALFDKEFLSKSDAQLLTGTDSSLRQLVRYLKLPDDISDVHFKISISGLKLVNFSK